MDGSAAFSPHHSVRMPTDIETLVQWAIGQTGRLPWRGVSDRELMLDGGYTVIPKGCDREFHGAGTVLSRAIEHDAEIVVEAIKAMEPVIAGKIILCARQCIRPDWMEGVEPKQVSKTISWRKVKQKKRDKRRGHRSHTILAWEPCDPEAIRTARMVYERWHDALERLADDVRHQLKRWQINSFVAPKRPWETGLKLSA